MGELGGGIWEDRLSQRIEPGWASASLSLRIRGWTKIWEGTRIALDSARATGLEDGSRSIPMVEQHLRFVDNRRDLPLEGVNSTNINSSEGSPLASGSFPWRKNGKNAVDLCDGIGLGMLSIDHPIKRDDLLKDIPDNKAFFPCALGCAKSHLK